MRHYNNPDGIVRSELKNYYVRASVFQDSKMSRSTYTHLFRFICKVPIDSDESGIKEHYIYIGHNKRTISLKRAFDTHNMHYPHHECMTIIYEHTLYRA